MEISTSQYIRNKKINSNGDLVEILNMIGPYIDGWSVSNPYSKTRLLSLCPRLRRKDSYKTFIIPKKSGGFRTIVAPDNELKNIQRAILKYLECLFVPNVNAMGFIRGKSIRNNAARHIGKNCVINLDLENFFPSITKKMLKTALQRELSDYIKSNEAINTICSLCTIPLESNTEVLAQGAPSSPFLSNVVMKEFDNDAEEFCRSKGFVYTRYADDLTISLDGSEKEALSLLSYFRQLIKGYGLKINESKIKILTKGKRMEVTGIITNEKLNLSRKFVKQLRVLLHLWEKNGYDDAQYIYKIDFKDHKEGELRSVIKGKLNYLKMVKGGQDPTFLNLNNRYNRLLFSWKGAEYFNEF